MPAKLLVGVESLSAANANLERHRTLTAQAASPVSTELSGVQANLSAAVALQAKHLQEEAWSASCALMLGSTVRPGRHVTSVSQASTPAKIGPRVTTVPPALLAWEARAKCVLLVLLA